MDRTAANDLFEREVVRLGLLSADALAGAEARVNDGSARDLVHAVVEAGLMPAADVKNILKNVVDQVREARASAAGAPVPAGVGAADLSNTERQQRIKADTEAYATSPAAARVQPDAAPARADEKKGDIKSKVRKPRVVHADLTDQKLGGRFAIVKLIGTGGMGAVWLARDEMLEKDVAIKVLPRTLTHDEQYRARFLREARAAARFEAHPNIVAVTYCDHDQTFDLLYMVMQYIDGVSLQALCDEELHGAVPQDMAVPIIRQVLDALGFAQRMGIVHRDIKPDNIIVENGSHRPWVTDFGLARFEAQASNLTAQGEVMGTPHFMSPEQCEGKVVDGRADLYAAGCVFYYMLTHEYAFDGPTTTAVIIAQLRKTPPLRDHVPTISPWLERLVMKLLTKKADQRYQTAEEALADLEAGVSGERSAKTSGSGAAYHVAAAMPVQDAEPVDAMPAGGADPFGGVDEHVTIDPADDDPAFASGDDLSTAGASGSGEYGAPERRGASISGRRPRRGVPSSGTSARRAAARRSDVASAANDGRASSHDRHSLPDERLESGENARFDRRNAVAAPGLGAARARRSGTGATESGSDSRYGLREQTERRGPDLHVVIIVVLGVLISVGVAAFLLLSR